MEASGESWVQSDCTLSSRQGNNHSGPCEKVGPQLNLDEDLNKLERILQEPGGRVKGCPRPISGTRFRKGSPRTIYGT